MESILDIISSRPDQAALKPPGKPKFVKLRSGDDGTFLPHVFFEDPTIFVPSPNHRGQVHAWGLFPYDDAYGLPEVDIMLSAARRMQYQVLYSEGGVFDQELTPEGQFVGELIKRKVAQMQTLELHDLDKRDVILRLSLFGVNDPQGQPYIWRRIRCSAGLKLSVFQDKVLQPVMGWVRNLHSYAFIDFHDGAVFGPKDANTVDSFYSDRIGYSYIPDDQYTIAHLFKNEGDVFGYTYDFGDGWAHEIQVESIISFGDSDGHVEVLDGRGMCPGENMRGCAVYSDFLKEYDDASPSKRAEKKREILGCPNYKDFGKPPSLFDPYTFDISAARQRVQSALSSTNSIRSGAKGWVTPLSQDASKTMPLMRKGEQLVRQFDPQESSSYWEEITSSTHDKRRQTACAACGKPGDKSLMACAACRQVMYCSKECQTIHWKQLHKSECSRQYSK